MSFDMDIHVERHTSRLERAPRTSRACGLCHTRKVKCDIGPTKPQCSNCQRDGQVCEQRLRQRKGHSYKSKPKAATWKRPAHVNASNPADAATLAAGTDVFALHQATSSQGEAGLSSQIERCQPAQKSMEERTQQDLDHPTGSSPSAGSITSISSSYDGGYMERSAYIAPDNFRAEDGSEINYPVPVTSAATQQIATLQDAFKFPPRAIRDALFENFWTHCYAWDPIVDRSQVVGVDSEKASPLLLQAIFLAGSRMVSPSQSRIFASPQEYYTRAKTLFWLDFEKDPMTLLIASSLMHWWNPHGPERVSTNTSSFGAESP